MDYKFRYGATDMNVEWNNVFNKSYIRYFRKIDCLLKVITRRKIELDIYNLTPRQVIEVNVKNNQVNKVEYELNLSN